MTVAGFDFTFEVESVSVKNTHYQQILELQVDKGEASAIALGIETLNNILVFDDYKARKVAVKLGLEITGTIGIIVKAKLNGVIAQSNLI